MMIDPSKMTEQDLIVYKLDHATLKVNCFQSAAMELSEAFKYEVKGAKHSTLFKMGRWDGYTRLFNLGKRTLPSGLYNRLLEVAEARGFTVHTIENQNAPEYGMPNDIDASVTSELIHEYVDSLNIHGGGNKITIYDYQYRAVYEALARRTCILLAATSSGKSMIVYAIARYITEVLGKKILVITPTVGLTSQFRSDFKDYSSHNGYDVDSNVHLISAGTDKNADKGIYISTYQSLKNCDADFMNQFACILTDEGHTITAESFKAIYGKATEVPYRMACTGTLHTEKVNILEMEALTGPVVKVATAAELIAAGRAVPLKVKALQLNYAPEWCAALKKADYDTEITWITNNPKRVNFVAKLAKNCVGTTLILFRFEEHGEAICAKIKELVGDTRPVYYIAGKVNKEEREAIRLAANSEDCIVVASSGTTKAGVNLPNIQNIIDAHPFRSKVTFLQSIGRGLRLKAGKTHCNLFTIGDNLTYKRKPNSSFVHFGVRLQLLAEEGHSFETVMIDNF